MFWKWKKSVNLDNSWHTSFKGKWTKPVTWLTITDVMYQLTIIPSSPTSAGDSRWAGKAVPQKVREPTVLCHVHQKPPPNCIVNQIKPYTPTFSLFSFSLNAAFKRRFHLPNGHVLSPSLLPSVLHVLPMPFTLNIRLLASPKTSERWGNEESH